MGLWVRNRDGYVCGKLEKMNSFFISVIHFPAFWLMFPVNRKILLTRTLFCQNKSDLVSKCRNLIFNFAKRIILTCLEIPKHETVYATCRAFINIAKGGGGGATKFSFGDRIERTNLFLHTFLVVFLFMAFEFSYRVLDLLDQLLCWKL